MELQQRPELLADRVIIWCIIRYWKTVNWLITGFQWLLFRKNNHPKKILVFRTGSLGDSICAMPAINNLKTHFSNSGIHLLTNAGKGHQNLVSMNALIASGVFERIINYENIGWVELTRQLRKEHYDLVVHLTQYDALSRRIIRDMLYFRLATGIRSGFGWQMDSVLLFRQVQEKYLHFNSERERLNKVLQKNGVPTSASEVYPLQKESSDRLKISNLLSVLPLKNRPAIAVVPGAKRLQNRWPIAHFREVIQHYCADYNIFIIGGPDDVELVAPLLSLPNIFSFCGQLTPVQSGLLMEHCRLVLSNDTGPMHLAYAYGVPVVALFSNRDFPQRWFPPENRCNIAIRATNIPCSVCLSEICQNNICMKRIAPMDVIKSMGSLLVSEVNKHH